MCKKISILVLCSFVLSAAVLYAGGKQASPAGGGGGGGSDPYANLPLEVSMSLLDRGAVPASEGSMENNRWTRFINENSGIKVTFVPVLRTESGARLNALFAAGTAPDMVWEYNRSYMDRWYDQGVLQPVDTHIENYSTAYKAYMKEHPELTPYMMEGNRQYGITTVRNIQATLNGVMWIRKDWLDKFGLQVPKTADELLNFMRMVRDRDPDGNGIKDTWGVTSNYSFDSTLRLLFGEPWLSYLIVDGHYVDWTSTRGYRDYLEYRAKITQEGLLDPEFITDTNYARQRQLLVTGKSGVHMQAWAMQGEWRELKQNVPTAEWIPMEPITTPYGRFGYGQEVPYLKMACMNKSARNPKAAMMLVDWFLEEGYWPLTWGIEGRHYRLVNGVPQTIDQEINKVEMYVGGMNAEFALADRNADRIKLDWIPAMAAPDALSQEWARLQMLAGQTILKDKYNRMVPYVPSSPSIQDYNTATTSTGTTGAASQVAALEAAIFSGKLSVDEGLRQINAYKNSVGWAAVNAEKDKWYQENKHLFQ